MLLLTVAVSAAAYARTTVGPLQETIRSTLSLSDNQIALLQGPALGLPMVVGAIPLGLVIDRHSRVRLLLLLAALNLAGSAFTALTPNFALLFGARSLVGFAALAINPVAISLLADLYAPGQRGRATMVMTIGQVGGVSAAFALGGVLLTMAGSGLNAWRWVMIWLTCPLSLVMVLMLAMREPSRTGVGIGQPSVRQAFAEVRRYSAVIVPLLVGVVTAEIAIGAVVIWAPPIFSRRFALPPDRVGAIMAAGLLVSGVLGPMAGGSLADLCQRTGGPRRTLSILPGLALLGAPSALFALMPAVGAASVLLALFMTIATACAVMGTVLFTVVVPNELRGLCIGMLVAGTVLFSGLAPLIVSLLSGALGGPAMIGKALALVGVTTSLLGAAIFFFGRRYFPRTAIQ